MAVLCFVSLLELNQVLSVLEFSFEVSITLTFFSIEFVHVVVFAHDCLDELTLLLHIGVDNAGLMLELGGLN